MSADGADRIGAAINDAEEILDPLDGLAERCAADPGAAFAPDVLERLAELKAGDRAAFETLRARLKKAGVRMAALDEAIDEDNGDAGNGRGPSQADALTDLALSADLFRTPEGTAYADIAVNGHRETWPIRSKGFKRWLSRRFYETTQGAPNSEALQAAMGVAEARAAFDAPERVVHVRVGGNDGTLYLDLGDEGWRAVEIVSTGWRVISDPPVRFRRSAGMLPLPLPAPGGSVESLRQFLNVATESDFVLTVSWLLAALRDRGPYPLVALTGEQGSAKSTFAAILRALVDPNTAPLRALPKEDRDLFIAATNSHVLAFDNLSSLPAWTSDALCRIATGGGFAVRQLYADQDETLFSACRPVILNGIEDIATRADLADRSLILTLEPIAEERRRPESELWAAFEAERPKIMGALLGALANGLKSLPGVRLKRLPRMADFARWATACETAIWPAGTFMTSYDANRAESVENVLDGDPVAVALRALMLERTTWSGSATEALADLAEVAGERVSKSKDWPVNARALSGRLRRAGSHLRKVGIRVDFLRAGRARSRTVTFTVFPGAEYGRDFASAPSAPSAGSAESHYFNDLAEPNPRTQNGTADASGPGEIPTVRANPLKTNEADGADAKDAKSRPYSGPGKTPGWSARL